MIGPSPTQQPPAPVQSPAQKKVGSTPIKPRMGQAPAALFMKSIFRPIFKLLYYVLQWIRGHKLITLALILLLLASSVATNYVITGTLPFVNNDPLQRIASYDVGSANHIRDWLYALRDGNASKLKALQANMLQTNVQPDPDSLVSRYGQPQTGSTWMSITVIGMHTASDTSVDSFVEVDLAAPGSKSSVSSILIVHFTTIPVLQGRIFVIDVLPARQYLQ